MERDKQTSPLTSRLIEYGYSIESEHQYYNIDACSLQDDVFAAAERINELEKELENFKSKEIL